MERTADFRQLVRRLSGGAALPQPGEAPSSAFIRLAGDQQQRLAQLRSSLQDDIDHAAAIQECRAQVKELEALVEDSSDLVLPPVWRPRDHLAHRRSLVSALYEDLKDIASRVQTEAMGEQRRASEVSSFFTAMPSASSTARLKPPPPPPPAADSSRLHGDGEQPLGRPPDAAEDQRLESEARALLAAYETDLDKIVETQAKLGELVNLVSVFSTKVVEQQEQVDNIHELAEESTEMVDRAGKHLDRAVENRSSYRAWLVCWFVGSAFFLLAYDYVDARFSPI